MTTANPRESPQMPFGKSVFYNLRYSGTSSTERLNWRRENLQHLCDEHIFVCLSELRNSQAVVDSLLVSHVSTHMAFYHCETGLPGQVILIQRSWAAQAGIGTQEGKRRTWSHAVLVQGCAHMVWWLEGSVVKAVVNLYLDSHSPALRVRQLKALAAAIRDFKHSMTEGHRFEFIFWG